MSEWGMLASGLAALCVVVWLFARWRGRPQEAAITRIESGVGDEHAGNGEPPQPVVLFNMFPAEPEATDVSYAETRPAAVASSIAAAEAISNVTQVDRGAPLKAAAIEPLVEPAAATPVRRRPRPAWELALDGQTPESLLARAHEHLAAGEHDEAAVQLRACARLASKLKEVAVEAVARLELGDLAQAHGDMTTACEHWQLARSLYAELQREVEVKASVKRMEKAGCPTDWVLTKF